MAEHCPDHGRHRLRVMIVSRDLSFGAGGMEKTAANLANHMAAAGPETCLVYRHNPKGAPLYAISEQVRRVPITGDPASLAEAAQEFCPDVIVYFYATHRERADIVALAQTGIPVVLHEGSNPQRVVETNWAAPKGLSLEQARLERQALMSMCARLRFTLPDYLDSLPPELRRDAVAFPNAFAPADPANLGIRSREGRKIFLNVGGLKRVKNVMAAIRAFATIAADLPDWDFHIFSAPQNNLVGPELDAFVARHGLEPRVKVFAPTPHIGREYGRSHIHVIASKEEGLPNCVAEAARHALPSIGFACCAGTNSMIVPERNGLLADCGEGEIESLAAAMRRMAEDHASRERWGQTALEESAIYDPARIFAQWEALIADAARDRCSLEERHRRRFGDSHQGRILRQVQKASFGAPPWPAEPPYPFDEDPPRVSIIVFPSDEDGIPAETLQSIADCPYPAKEVIVVDEGSIGGSTDGSPAVISEACARHGWRLVRYAASGGPSAARNAGLEAATGEYVHFWDAGDLYASDGIGRLLRAMWNNCADIGLGRATRDGEIMAHCDRSMHEVPPVTFASDPDCLRAPSCRCMVYRRDFLLAHELRFEPGLYMQDFELNLRAFPLAERISPTTAILGECRPVEDPAAPHRSAHHDAALKIEELTHDFYARNGLHALDAVSQQHVLGTVLPMFVQRARRDRMPVDDDTQSHELDFELLTRLRERMPRLSEGLRRLGGADPRLALSYFAIREGYLIWLCDFLAGRKPAGDVIGCLAAIPAEHPMLRHLLTRLAAADGEA